MKAPTSGVDASTAWDGQVSLGASASERNADPGSDPAPAYGSRPIRRSRRSQRELATLDVRLLSIVHEQAPMTVRQVFYQAVRHDLVPKDETRGYRAVQRRLKELRLSGRMPYDWIADNVRTVHGFNRWRDLTEFGSHVASLYRRDFWSRSSVRVEMWIEKDALAGVIAPIVISEWGLDLYVARGFSSITYLENAAATLRADGRPAHVYVLTDFDPSGVAIADTVMRELPTRAAPVPVSVERIALTPEQITQFDLPSRPVKRGDSRSKKFVASYGHDCTDLDALPPQTLRELVSDAIERHADRQELARLKRVEAAEREQLEKLGAFFDVGGDL